MSEGGRKDAEEMKKLLLLFFCLISTSAVAQLQFNKGNALKEYCQSTNVYEMGFCIGYVVGVADNNAMSICMPPGVSQGQIRDIVKKYLNDNPAQLHRDADVLVLNALQQAFPCPKKK